jgi:hypothetical protein
MDIKFEVWDKKENIKLDDDDFFLSPDGRVFQKFYDGKKTYLDDMSEELVARLVESDGN